MDKGRFLDRLKGTICRLGIGLGLGPMGLIEPTDISQLARMSAVLEISVTDDLLMSLIRRIQVHFALVFGLFNLSFLYLLHLPLTFLLSIHFFFFFLTFSHFLHFLVKPLLKELSLLFIVVFLIISSLLFILLCHFQQDC